MADLIAAARLHYRQEYWPCYSSMPPAQLRTLDYHNAWQAIVSQRWFDFQLDDGSLLQFRPSNESTSYVYIETPKLTMTYSKFVLEFFGEEVDEVGDTYAHDYQTYLETEPLRQHVTPIRYDYSPGQYAPNRHPAAHLHVGVDNEIRIAVERIWTPVSFTAFVLRQCYPSNWLYICSCADQPFLESLRKSIRASLELPSSDHRICETDTEVFLR